MERIFNNSSRSVGILATTVPEDMQGTYEGMVVALIADAVDFEESELAPDREVKLRYYDAIEPRLANSSDALDLTGDPPVDDEEPSRSTIVSTDVRDTILSIMPNLLRIFAGTEHAVEYDPTSEATVDMAAQATDYVRHKLWKDNDGFTLLYGAFWDALVTRAGILAWGREHTYTVSEKKFDNITEEQLQAILSEEQLSPELISYDPPVYVAGIGYTVSNVRVRYTKPSPSIWIDGVAPENFRISRKAKNVKTARLVGYEEILPFGDLVEKGYDLDELLMHVGADFRYSADEDLRNPGGNIFYPLNDLVKWGCYFIRIDQDGDGINELREIHTVGEDYNIVYDEIVEEARIALFTGDLRPHTAIGGSATDWVMDIQKIKTNLIRGGLDSLAQSIFPRTAFNELLVNVEDVMSDDVGAPIRTRGNPSEVIQSWVTPFVGGDTFKAAEYLDKMRFERTGVSDASKGIDPKAFQSTNMAGIDAIVTGAQERIEMIARIFAETGMKDLYNGLLKEFMEMPDFEETVQLRGKWVKVQPSLYDPNLKASVNPMLGKGSDQTRLMSLQAVSQAQMAIVNKFGLGNGVVGPQELRNTQVDILALVNIRNVNRYFRPITDEQAHAMETAPKDPDAPTILAQSQMEKVRSDTTKAIATEQRQTAKDQADDDFRRDKLNIDSMLHLMELSQDGVLAKVGLENDIIEMNQPEPEASSGQ